jgi:ribosome-associated translation inhibitor RaiA
MQHFCGFQGHQMRVQIQVIGLGAAKLRRFAAQKLDVALACFPDGIEAASVRLRDINGADRGGVDKLCRVVLTLKGDAVLVIEELGSNILQAIERAAERLRQRVSRQLSRAPA